MALKSRAEVQLLQVLNQSKATSVSFYLKEQQQQHAEDTSDTDGESESVVHPRTAKDTSALHRTDLKRFRREASNQHARDEDEAIAQVRQLQDNYYVIGSSENDAASSHAGASQIEANALARRNAHMTAQQRYTEQVKQISEEIEATLIQSADRVKDALAHTDAQLRAMRSSLHDDALLLQSTSDDIERLWTERMAEVCVQRTRVLDAFADELDAIERTRIQRVRAELTHLTAVLMDTAHALPPEVERIIEAEAHELNAVVLSNRKVYADLVARMATADVTVFVDTRLAWETGQRHWRTLRHADAIATFQTRLNSREFTDPDERRNVLAAARMHQEAVHRNERLAVLAELEAARAGLTTEAAAQLLQRVSAAQVHDETQSHAFFSELMALHIAKGMDAERLREALRLELHGFGALATEGDIAHNHDALATLLSDSALEELFRMAGGLRSELDAVVKRLVVSELIYDEHLTALTTSVVLLQSALPLERVMETNGKGAERKALQATLEKIRKASKHEIAPLLPALQTQLSVLRNVSDMADTFTLEVEDIALQLEALVLECSGLHSGGSDPGTSAATSELSPGRSSSASASLATVGSRTQLELTGSLSTASGISPPKSKATTTMSSSTESSQSALDLQAIRKVQRRLGTLLYASELPPPMQQHLSFIAEQLALQANANAVVDAVIAAECDDLLATRALESKLFLEALGRAMELQSTRLHDQTERLTKFGLELARCMEQSVERVRFIDLSALDLLDALEDADAERLADFEAQYSESCARVRHAPNDVELTEAFDAAMALLQAIEREYRLYHRKVGVAAAHHVQAITVQQHVVLEKLCSYFGLRVVGNESGLASDAQALDVATFLSLSCIDNIVDPPAQGSSGSCDAESDGDRVENPQDGTGASTKRSHSTPRADAPAPAAAAAAQPDKPRKSSKHALAHAQSPRTATAAIPADVPIRFHASSGLEAEIIVAVPDVVAKILVAHDASADDGAGVASDETVESEEPVATPAPPASDQPLPGDAAPDTQEADALALAAHAKLQQQQQAASDSVATEFLHLEIPSSLMEQIVTALRDAFVSRLDQDTKATADVTHKTQAQRVAAVNLLLEERLRMHWPRSGRLGVQLHQPRMGELLSHRQRQERQIRSVLAKADAQATAFSASAAQALEHAAHVRTKQVACQAQLPMQASLAALQGLEGKSKALLSAFRSESTETLAALRARSETDVAVLRASLQDFVRACASQVFPDLTSCDVISGCDYHPNELAALQDTIAAIESQLHEQVQAREARIAELEQAQAQVLELAQTFKTRYQRCVQTLSMTDGLGQKYGLPRRTAQERYRSEVTRCDERSAAIDALLASLQALVERKEPLSTSASDADTATVIVRHLLQLRAKVFARGQYFQLLKNVSQLEPTPIELTLATTASTSLTPGTVVLRDTDVVDEADRSGASGCASFLAFVADVSARCRDNTRQLFAQEGKLDELPNGGVPPSLEAYLTALDDKARAYVLLQEHKYREQVHLFGELLALAPERALTSVLDRASKTLRSKNEQLAQALASEMEVLLAQKQAHTVELRPELCSPNNTLALQALSDREAARSQRTVASLQHTRAQLMAQQVDASCAFERELVALFRCLMAILDSCVMTLDDLRPVSGEELPKLERKSLKRLRKVARVLELGDVREVKRSDAELQRLAQLGETPRFPKRAWPRIDAFGMHVVCEAQQAELLSHDEQHALPRDEALTTLDCSAFAANDDGACVGLLTHAHRSLVSARDAAHAAFQTRRELQHRELVDGIQEKLRDERKWLERWQAGIAAMHVGTSV